MLLGDVGSRDIPLWWQWNISLMEASRVDDTVYLPVCDLLRNINSFHNELWNFTSTNKNDMKYIISVITGLINVTSNLLNLSSIF